MKNGPTFQERKLKHNKHVKNKLCGILQVRRVTKIKANKVTTSQLTNVTAFVISSEKKIDRLSGRYSKIDVFVPF